MKSAIIIVFVAFFCATFGATLDKSNGKNPSQEIIPPNASMRDAEILLDRYIVSSPTRPMNWTTGREYCRNLSALDPEKRHHLILEHSEEILPVSFKMQEQGVREVWTDGRSDPTGTFYVWYTLNDGKPIDLPELEQPCPGEDVYFNALTLRGDVLSGADMSEEYPVVCELPDAPTA